MMANLSVEECRRLFDYDQINGLLIWKPRQIEEFASEMSFKIWTSRCAGKPAGCATQRDRYVLLTYKKKTYRAHRIIWTLAYGNIPDQIDHINGDIRDNRLENLRNVSTAENAKNQKRRVTNTTGATGVSWRYGAWRAEIFAGGIHHYLGKFEVMADAIEARKDAEVKFGFHPNHGRAA